ncbi:DUF1883 domain-containing protein [Enterobacter asburiae]|uniref:DUF1883 domain-containing protein n=1 Tax=Enterobacter asburiae TaxID=61645 RepID=UPI002075408D|nr:DUF1883 domain-containing protein [Enterobacter asburiae]MCM7773465.1 DUF1883 domain-containing protein [Enterobacter asburiae]
MDFLHTRVHLKTGDIVEVHVSHPCTILVMPEDEFERFHRGEKHRCHRGGYFVVLPARIPAPAAGLWHIVIDAGRFIPGLNHDIRIYPV